MYYIGSCTTNPTQGNCRTYWPEPDLDSLGAVTYDELRTVGSSTVAPSGTGNFLIASGISGSCSTAGICSNTDSLAAATSYTVPAAAFVPKLNFWPGSLVLGNAARVHMNNVAMAGGGIVATSYLPSVFAQHGLAGGSAASHSPFWAVYEEGDSAGNNNASVGAVIKQAGPASGAASSGLTGLYGFLSTAALGQTDMLTFAYSNPFLTLATPGYRPAASATDTAAGFDSPSGSWASTAQFAFRAPVAISEYIGNVFDNASYKERLTATAKTFNVPVTINGSLTVTGGCTGCGGSGGSMTWPSGAGIAVYSGSSSWGTSLAAPASAIVGVSDAQTLTNKTVDGVSPTTMTYLDATSSVQTQLNGKAPSASPTFTGTVTLPVTGSGSQCLHVSSTGVLSGTGSDCGSGGGGGGSGTVNSANANQIALYSATGTAVSGDTALTDNGTTLAYAGSGGLSANSGAFSGNVTVGGQLILTGPWLIDTPLPGATMGAATSGTSSFGISNDGNFYISANAGTPSKVLTTATDAVPSVFGRTGAISAASGDYSVSQVTGAAPLASPTFTGTVTEPVPTWPSQSANTFWAAPSGSAGGPSFRAIVGADIPTLNQNTTGTAGGLSGTPSITVNALTATTINGAAMSGTFTGSPTLSGNPAFTGTPTFSNPVALGSSTATTQTATDSSTKIATDQFVSSNFAAMSVSNAVGDIAKISGNSPTPTITDSGAAAPPYAIPWLTVYRGGGTVAFTQNVVKMWGVVLTYPITTSTVAYYVQGADNTSNLYDIGIACGNYGGSCGSYSAGQIILNIGATAGTTFAPVATSAKTTSWSQGSRTLQPGKYFVVITTNCSSSCATIGGNGDSYAATFQNGTTAGTTSNGALASFTAPSDVWSWGGAIPSLAVK